MLHNLDSDSSKIIEAVRATGVVVTEAMRFYVDYIVSGMKAIGTWQLSNAVYGFVGGTAASHKFNWKNPIDTDGAFRLTFLNSWTHDSQGAKPNNVNATTGSVANTFLVPTGYEDNISLVYTTNENIISGWSIMVDINAGELSPLQIAIDMSAYRADFGSGLYVSGNYAINPSVIQTIPTNNSKGVYVVTRNSLSIQKSFKNGIIANSNNTTISSFSITRPFYLAGALVSGSSFASCSPRRHQCTIIANSFTDTQAQLQSQLITNAQLILNRA